ncbi:MAG: MBOAT family protein [Lachnospiraceae bacterium]|nr:MBOAT family protein [Lachnospiraceae bacterium]
MLFNSVDFIVFFPVVFAILLVIPKRARYIWLLVSSYFFYMSWNPKYALLILASTFITWLSALLVSRYRAEERKKANICLVVCVVLNLAILVVFKYAGFLFASLNDVFSRAGITFFDRRFDLLLPVGISFYTFQALSYSIDVYRNNIQPERNFLRYALYVSFFPQLVAGPIERSVSLLPQLQNIENVNLFDYDRIRDGFLLMMWGFFQKLVIADRAALLVKPVIRDYGDYGLIELSIATVLFAVQIYCDFGGYTNIARGAAAIMGIRLMQNFRQPYLATGIRDFWKRWHISLTSWFTDYVYIPLGGNRRGTLRTYVNTVIVFALSGLWHGASWNFVAWGLIHAFYRVAESLALHLRAKLSARMPVSVPPPLTLSGRIGRILVTFALTCFAWIFFVSPDLTHACNIIRQMASVLIASPDLLGLGLDLTNWRVLFFAVIVLGAVDILHEKGVSVFDAVSKQQLWFRWTLYLGLIWSVLLFGIYGAAYDESAFIYFRF